jgi:hypothetical protein
MTSSSFVPAAVAACLLCACSASPPPRAARAGQLPCEDAEAWQDELRLLDARTLLKVEPTTWVDMCSGAAQVTGTRLRIRRSEASSERLSPRLAQMLQCSSARVLVGEVDRSQLGDDRLWLPEGWVDVDVKREAGDYSVRLSAENVAKNLQLLRRATAFARAQHPAFPGQSR